MRVVVAEDGVLFRDGLVRLLGESGVVVTSAVGDAPALLAAVAADRPDAVIVDVRMPPGQRAEGLEAALRIRAGHPGVAVLVLSHHVESVHTARLLADDAHGVGYLLKDRVADADELVDTLRRLIRGECVVDPIVVGRLLDRRTEGPAAVLSAREREVLALMAQGRSNAAIGRLLGLRPKTVEAHVRSVFARLGLPESADDHRRVLAVLGHIRGSR